MKTTDDWRSAIDKNAIVGSVFIFLSKAFDSISHKLLLYKLSCYGFGQGSLRWFQSYLEGRKQRVLYGRQTSDWSNVLSGVPQGSTLGPILFSLYVNDLPLCLNACKIMLYADDITVYYYNHSIDKVKDVLSKDLAHLASWLVHNNLQLNLNKTKLMCFSRKGRKSEANNLDICISNTTLEKCEEVKFLGVIVDRNLTWESHIQLVRRKCLFGLFTLRRVRKYLSTNLLKLLYQSFIQSHLDYCSTVWAECHKSDLMKLKQLQTSGMRLILNEQWTCPSTDMRSRLGWLSIENKLKMQILICVKRYVDDGGSKCVKMFTTRKEMGLRSSRDRDTDLFVPTPHTDCMMKSFLFKGSTDWNSLPINLRKSSDLSFRTGLLKYFNSM